MDTNVCCENGRGFTIGPVNNLYVSCCCKCGCNGGEHKPDPPTPEAPKIYGIRIDKNNPDPADRITYTNDAVGMKPAFMNYETGQFDYGSWKDVWFVKENKPVMLNYDGTEAYDLNPDDYSKKQDGTPSDVANADFPGNAMATIPLIWMKSWEDDQYEYYNVCQSRPDETYHANAFTRRDGSVADCKYIRMFKASLFNGKLRSLSEKAVANMQTAASYVTQAEANGEHWYTISYSEWDLIGTLLRILSKTEDSQKAFGNGCTKENGTTINDALPTGTLNQSGQFMGYQVTTKQIKVLHMEEWWGNLWSYVAGLVLEGGRLKVKETPPYKVDGTEYLSTGITLSGTSEMCITQTKAFPFGRLPRVISGTGNYTCDGLRYSADSKTFMAAVGGACNHNNGWRCGINRLGANATKEEYSWTFCAGFSCEQPQAQ